MPIQVERLPGRSNSRQLNQCAPMINEFSRSEQELQLHPLPKGEVAFLLNVNMLLSTQLVTTACHSSEGIAFCQRQWQLSNTESFIAAQIGNLRQTAIGWVRRQFGPIGQSYLSPSKAAINLLRKGCEGEILARIGPSPFPPISISVELLP